MKIAIHQPQHAPWLGFFHKMSVCDLFVMLDVVQYEKNNYQNRNRIRVASTDSGWTWLTVPVLAKGRSKQSISEVEINVGDSRWGDRIWRTIAQNYATSKYFQEYSDFIREIYLESHMQSLADLNFQIIKYFMSRLGLTTPVVKASDIVACGAGSKLLLSICKELDASTYLSGPFGRDYLDESIFRDENIAVEYHDFHHPEYQQVYEPFISGMSALDLLCNHGPLSMDIILGQNVNAA